MNYLEAREYIAKASKFGIRPGLERITELMRRLGDPQESLKIFHIAGTNGKGSISSYLSHILAASGYQVGWFTSPYLERFSERMRIIRGPLELSCYDQTNKTGEIKEHEFSSLITKIKREVEAMLLAGLEHPTEFELITAAAFLWFKENELDFAVIETGLGGRLDSTNIIKKPKAVIISSISYDHTDILGKDIAAIALEKAGIMKELVPVFAFDPQDSYLSLSEQEKIRGVLRKRAKELSCPLCWIKRVEDVAKDEAKNESKNEADNDGKDSNKDSNKDKNEDKKQDKDIDKDKYNGLDNYKSKNNGIKLEAKAREDKEILTSESLSLVKDLGQDKEGQSFSSEGEVYKTKLLGSYQQLNALLAIKAAEPYARREIIKEAVFATVWPGRLEICSTDPFVLLDGAHNVQAARALSSSLQAILPDEKITLLVGMLKDKDIDEILSVVLENEDYKIVKIFATEPDNPRKLSALALEEKIKDLLAGLLVSKDKDRYNISVTSHADAQKTARMALEYAKQGGYSLVAFGSLYLAGEIRSILRGSD